MANIGWFEDTPMNWETSILGTEICDWSCNFSSLVSEVATKWRTSDQDKSYGSNNRSKWSTLGLIIFRYRCVKHVHYHGSAKCRLAQDLQYKFLSSWPQSMIPAKSSLWYPPQCLTRCMITTAYAKDRPVMSQDYRQYPVKADQEKALLSSDENLLLQSF